MSGDWSAGWLEEVFNLTDVYSLGNLAGSPSVWLIFAFNSDDTITFPEGAYVDDVLIRKRPDPPGAASSVPAFVPLGATRRDAAFSISPPAGQTTR